MEINKTSDIPTVKSKIPKFLYLFPFLTFLILFIGGLIIWNQRQSCASFKKNMTGQVAKCFSEKAKDTKVIGSSFYEEIFKGKWNSTFSDYTSKDSEYSFKYSNDLKLKTAENTFYFISKWGDSPVATEKLVDSEIKCWQEMAKEPGGGAGVCAESMVGDLQMKIELLTNEEDYAQDENCSEQNTKLAGKKIYVCLNHAISGLPIFVFYVTFGSEEKRYLASMSFHDMRLVTPDIKTIIETIKVKGE